MMRHELVGKIMIEFVPFGARMYAYRKTDGKLKDKRCKETKSVQSLKALLLVTIRSACLQVKQYT